MRLPTKDKQIAVRLDDAMYDRVSRYAYAKHMYVGELLRAALREYMLAHPINEKDTWGATTSPQSK